DLVFTGGRSLHRSVQDVRPSGAHCFPSGVEPEHYETAIALRRRRSPGGRPVAGYIGVIDERMDLDLLADLATELDDWEIRMVGPVVKIEPSDLPRRGNITYTGARHYAELPTVLAGFDVALMPFAVDDATRAISPTKTLEYLAAGLPVVSTPVPDVVADYAAVVAIAPDAAGFAAACRHTLGESAASRSERVWPMLHAQRWDVIADKMRVLMDGAGREPADAVEESA
ncbi:MAG TPA: glycosyltransferase, partial [Acidimicrobiales bacterium]|nr:glycosyltransferase [Acidimicrobiales bacterium]